MELDEAQWAVVHHVRLRGLVRVDDSLDDAVVASLVAAEAVVVRNGFVALTASGRAAHAAWARVPETSDAFAGVRLLDDAFGELNRELLAVCTAWQVLPSGAPNDHRDARHDWAVIDRLERLHERAAPRVRRAARDVARFGDHERRLRHALKQVVDHGRTEFFTGTSVDSYHLVWNQLHEDLLLALGRDRADEAAS